MDCGITFPRDDIDVPERDRERSFLGEDQDTFKRNFAQLPVLYQLTSGELSKPQIFSYPQIRPTKPTRSVKDNG